MRQERITSPFGYGRLEVLKRKDYVRLNPNGEVPVFVSGAEVLPVTFSELMLASSSFPVVFIQPAGAQQYMPVVMTGLEKGINLFTTIEAGAKKSTQKVLWDTNAYLPAYVRRHPFCMSTVNGEAGADDELLVCVQADYVSKTPSEGYVALFDSKEQPTEHWNNIQQFLQSYQADIALTTEFCNFLANHGLFHDLTANINVANAQQPLTIKGMFGINEEKLAALYDAVIADMQRTGYLQRVNAHLQSMQNFEKLLRRMEK
ncbi:MAG: hypothetical protein RLZZ151_472 [Pseudomonadota bacterium]|jgi:hypothetical protein